MWLLKFLLFLPVFFGRKASIFTFGSVLSEPLKACLPFVCGTFLLVNLQTKSVGSMLGTLLTLHRLLERLLRIIPRVFWWVYLSPSQVLFLGGRGAPYLFLCCFLLNSLRALFYVEPMTFLRACCTQKRKCLRGPATVETRLSVTVF